MWKEDELFICESNAISGYWPINGIQCNPYEGTFDQKFITKQCQSHYGKCLKNEISKLYGC